VTLKLAATLDGKIATGNGDSQWISGARSRALVHRWRNEMDAVLVGAGTVKSRRPATDLPRRRRTQSYRVVLDSRLRIPLTAQLFKQKDAAKTIIATTTGAPAARVRTIDALGAQVWRLPAQDGQVAWQALLKKLAGHGIVSVLIEGGAGRGGFSVKHKVVDKGRVFLCAEIIGRRRPGDDRRFGDRQDGSGNRVKKNFGAARGRDLLVSAYL